MSVGIIDTRRHDGNNIYTSCILMKNRKIEVGQLWEVKSDNFLVNLHASGATGGRKVLLRRGEIIEVRFPFAWHFRTQDNIYMQAPEPEFREHCKFYGVIWSEVRFNNVAELKDILRLKLFWDKKRYKQRKENGQWL